VVAMVVLAANRIAWYLPRHCPGPLLCTTTVTEIESPGLPLVGLAVMLEITRSGNDATAVTVNGWCSGC